MYHLPSIFRTARTLLLLVLAWATAAQWAMAQMPGPQKQEGGVSQYTLVYFLMLFGIILGMAVVLRGSNRRDEGPQQYVQKNILKED